MVLAQSDLRRSSLASPYVARAFAFSLVFHLLLFATLELGYQTGFWKATVLFAEQQRRLDVETARQREEIQQQREEEIPLVFVEVDPNLATPAPPKDAKYYSALNSLAANPDIQKDTPVPKIDGVQEHVPQTMERATPQAQPLQPAPAPAPQPTPATPPPERVQTPAPPKPQPPPEPAPEKPTHVGDLALAKPSEKPIEPAEVKPREPVERPRPPEPRPRTLEAARRQRNGVAGEKVKQAGGVKRFSLEPSFDVRATPFGAYDAAIIAAIQKRWYDLLESRSFAASYSGKVILEFRLNSDGRVTDMKVSENGVTEILGLLCQRAVQDPAPFAPWPADLRRLVGKEYRDVRFTFYYN